MTSDRSSLHSRGRHVRRILIALSGLPILAAAMILPAPGAGAVVVGGGATPFGASPAALPDGTGRAYFQLPIAAGQSATDSVVLTNKGAAAETLRLSPSTGVTQPTSGTSFAGYYRACTGTACWITGLPATETLAAGMSQTVPFTVSVPVGTADKQYLAGITVEPATAPSPIQVGGNGKASAHAIIVHQADVGVAVTVGDLSRMASRLTIPAVTAGAVQSIPRLYVQVRNTGQTFTKAAGVETCTQNGRQTTASVGSDTILPAEGASLVVNAVGLTFGSAAHCRVTLSYPGGTGASWTGTVMMPASAPPTTIIHTGPGTYASIPASGTPLWAVALIVLAGLIIVFLLALLLLRRRHRDPAANAGV